MLDTNTSAQLKTLLERLESPIEIVASLNGSDKSDKIKELVTEIAALSDQVTARFLMVKMIVNQVLVSRKLVSNHVYILLAYQWGMSSHL